ncbi:Anti-sigma-B factor antagonist [Fundidesulfovibrio magnetotacticus]|uniref:Anti-sigma-B factor antagonist n=1 Tax=Fundidesulfovibrio magnetotacticus TaxID=2730080 RepID=A0A6V8LRS8_9BACT|nr:STAS domain-containing protein [Fundidesulfovibrio magnetotacticus]GFK95182.1 Anti-sigma-B factor antagonist [Fundidesulfovibrio magnetotacticus]
MSATVRPETNLVASQADAFKSHLKEALSESPGELTVDLSGVTAVDSVGLGVLIAAHNTLAKQGGALRLENVPGDILKLLRAMRLDRHFHVNA